jgi:Tol biopolymer transport system component
VIVWIALLFCDPGAAARSAGVAAKLPREPSRPLVVFDAGTGVFVAAADGSEKRRVVGYAGPYPASPSWSGDGRRIVYVRTSGACNCHTDLYWTTLDGKRRKRLTRGQDNSNPQWSPRTSNIAFQGRDAIRIINDVGTRQRSLTAPGVDGAPVWSPDGRMIAFGWARHGTYVMNSDGTGFHRVSPIASANPVWAPDGKSLAFSGTAGYLCRGSCRASVYIASASGQYLQRVTDPKLDASAPSWSPDGKSIAFVGRHTLEGDMAIYVANRGRPASRVVSQGWISASFTSWSPDGKRIAFVGNRPCSEDCQGIYVIDATGRNLHSITRGVELRSFAYAWQPV